MIEFYVYFSWLFLKPIILPAIAVIAAIVGFACLFAWLGGASKRKLLFIGMATTIISVVLAVLAFIVLFANALQEWH